MEVILREDVPALGIIGDVVKVKPGYARNYLVPQGLAVPADRRNLARLEHEKAIIEVKKQRERGTYERLADTLKKMRLEIEARAGRGGKLFGSVTNIDVHRLITEKGLEIDRRRIELKEPIKEIGEFQVLVRVGQDITASVPLIVKPAGGVLEGGEQDLDREEQVAAAPQEPTEA
jgi:large subunit ribosomal protein L9